MNRSIRIQIPTGDIHDAIELAVVFERRADRWTHHWTVSRSAGQPVRFLISVEGTAETRFPPSPPIQDLDLHELGNGEAILGVGMAGRSHWSASFAGCSADQTIEADLACLQKQSPEDDPSPFLGSTYGVPESVQCDISDARVQLRVPELDLEMQITSPQHSAAFRQSKPNQVVLEPAQRTHSKAAATRWKYMIGRLR